jgi:hypothetical protein
MTPQELEREEKYLREEVRRALDEVIWASKNGTKKALKDAAMRWERFHHSLEQFVEAATGNRRHRR